MAYNNQETGIVKPVGKDVISENERPSYAYGVLERGLAQLRPHGRLPPYPHGAMCEGGSGSGVEDENALKRALDSLQPFGVVSIVRSTASKVTPKPPVANFLEKV
jgi:hypothetical protein